MTTLCRVGDAGGVAHNTNVCIQDGLTPAELQAAFEAGAEYAACVICQTGMGCSHSTIFFCDVFNVQKNYVCSYYGINIVLNFFLRKIEM